MKSITFTVQIQADFYDRRERGKKAAAILLCDDINLILGKYEAVTGGAQIVYVPESIKVTDSAEGPSKRPPKRVRKTMLRVRSRQSRDEPMTS